ncbi:MAG: PHP domain-containing protein [Sedimentibacter sp.]
MKFFYDMHIHSDLSPCGNSDMTPNNIVNMSYIKGLNIISVTDHNTTKNLPAIIELCENVNIKAIPGIEVTTKEEVHVLCYFKELNNALKFGAVIYDSLPDIKNNPSIFGNQNIYNNKDEITGVLEKLLINASGFSLNEICSMTLEYEGISVPAHINKKSNSILGVLGFIPYDLKLNFVEINSNDNNINSKLIKNLKILKNSDAHQLTDISEARNFFELNSIEDIYEYLMEES